MFFFFSFPFFAGGGVHGDEPLRREEKFEREREAARGARDSASLAKGNEGTHPTGRWRPAERETSEQKNEFVTSFTSRSSSHSLISFGGPRSFQKHRNNNAWLRRRLLEGAFGAERGSAIGRKGKKSVATYSFSRKTCDVTFFFFSSPLVRFFFTSPRAPPCRAGSCPFPAA